VGTGAPAENTFTPKGQVNPDYIRSDSLIGAPFTTNTVAEGFMGSLSGISIGQSSTSVSAPITVAAPGTVTLSFTANGNLTTTITGPLPASAQASFAFNFTIQNAAGVIVFSSTPDSVNQSISQNTIGTSTISDVNTPVTIISGQLAAGTYTASITQTSRVFLTQNAVVPEPSSLLMGGMAFGVLGGVLGWRNRRSTRTS